MKKILFALFILVLIAVVSLVVFIATFDANRYKTTVEEKITQAIGKPVKIGALSLKLKGGIAFQADQVRLMQPLAVDTQQISFEVERFFLKLELAPLLRKEIQVSECLLESPRINIENTVHLASSVTSTPAPEVSSGSFSTSSVSSVPDFYISRIKISNGTLSYRDQNLRPPFHLIIENFELDLKGVSLKSPIQFKASGDLLLGDRKYFSAEGQFSYPDNSIETDLRLDQSIQMSGSLDNIFKIPSGTFKIKIDGLDLSTFLTQKQKQGEYFTGILSADLTASARGMNADDLKRSLNSAGFVSIVSGTLKNKNLLRENLERLTQIPGIGALFEFNLGPRFDALLQSPDTQFDEFKANFKIANEIAVMQSIELSHEDYAINLKGSAGLDQTIDLKGALAIGSALSEAMAKKVKELALILDAQNQLVIPFVYRGRLPGAVPQPDLGSFAARTIQSVGTELLDQALTSLLKPKKSSESEAAPSQP